ncbi:ATP-binding protein [Halomicrobium urmianum]|uniref:ATP-binding protein n=1 Tax=Halomicrobium urmianum TaxID=1586233 RepID=UPI001CD954CF|nr:ATP-binding protein [Halomicrobium urmianum]
MSHQRVRSAGPSVLVALGSALLVISLLYHLRVERRALDASGGPLLALAVDGLLALILAFAGSVLADADLRPADEWRVVAWTVAGGALLSLAHSATVAVRLIEHRELSEPVFVALVTVEVGALAGFVAGFYNARARRDARQSRRARQALGFVNRALRHDLGNQLTVVRGRADVIEDAAGSTDPARIREWAADVSETVDQSETLIDSTGTMAETLLGDTEGDAVDLAAVAAAVCERADERYRATVDCDLPDSAMVRGNESLQSVVSNLVENAVEHGSTSPRSASPREDAVEHGSTSPGSQALEDGPGEPAAVDASVRSPDGRSASHETGASRVAARRAGVGDLTVDVSVAVDGDVVTLRVADDGVGVPDERKASLFEPRGDEAHGGGLHLAATLVERFDGSISVSDNDPRGAVFTVELPRAP